MSITPADYLFACQLDEWHETPGLVERLCRCIDDLHGRINLSREREAVLEARIADLEARVIRGMVEEVRR